MIQSATPHSSVRAGSIISSWSWRISKSAPWSLRNACSFAYPSRPVTWDIQASEAEAIIGRRRRVTHPAATGNVTDHAGIVRAALRHRRSEMRRKNFAQPLSRVVHILDHFEALAAFFASLSHEMGHCQLRQRDDAMLASVRQRSNAMPASGIANSNSSKL